MTQLTATPTHHPELDPDKRRPAEKRDEEEAAHGHSDAALVAATQDALQGLQQLLLSTNCFFSPMQSPEEAAQSLPSPRGHQGKLWLGGKASSGQAVCVPRFSSSASPSRLWANCSSP